MLINKRKDFLQEIIWNKLQEGSLKENEAYILTEYVDSMSEDQIESVLTEQVLAKLASFLEKSRGPSTEKFVKARQAIFRHLGKLNKHYKNTVDELHKIEKEIPNVKDAALKSKLKMKQAVLLRKRNVIKHHVEKLDDQFKDIKKWHGSHTMPGTVTRY